MQNHIRKFFITACTLYITVIPYSGILTASLQDSYLTTLPTGFMAFEEFEEEFSLGNVSTEQLHPITTRLSQVMHTSIVDGMELLLQVDVTVVQGLKSFIPSITNFAPFIAEKVSQGGRVFLVGSGSSGRVAVDIAAKCSAKFPKIKEQIQGIIAGGDSALIRAKEGFEDSEADGEAALQDAHVGPKDTVILISASGSASFNVGCGQFAANKGASVFYFYNSNNIPLRTQRLFEQATNPVIPLCLDIGPQAIGGSTRLQGASLAEGCLGALLGSTLYLTQGETQLAEKYPIELIGKLQRGVDLIKGNIKALQLFSQLEVEVFSHPYSNFRQLQDIHNQGYVTFVALEDSMREVLIDSTETSPTFSTSPIRREKEIHKKQAEFRAYMVGQGNNSNAWNALVGRDVHSTDIKDTETFLLACEEDGNNAFSKRPIHAGNFLIGVAKVNEAISIPSQLTEILDAAKKQGGLVGLLVLCRGKFSDVWIEEIRDSYDCVFILENTPSDAIGFTETIILKQLLNIISNSSMILMNKVHGNRMIDVRASNKKLVDRCIRLIKDIWTEYQSNPPPSDKLLYHYVAHISAIKKSYETKGVYTPSVVKIALAMLALKKTPSDFQEVIEYLAEKQERIDWIGGN